MQHGHVFLRAHFRTQCVVMLSDVVQPRPGRKARPIRGQKRTRRAMCVEDQGALSSILACHLWGTVRRRSWVLRTRLLGLPRRCCSPPNSQHYLTVRLDSSQQGQVQPWVQRRRVHCPQRQLRLPEQRSKQSSGGRFFAASGAARKLGLHMAAERARLPVVPRPENSQSLGRAR